MMENKVKELTWKYFWQQKIKEIGIGVGIALCLIFLPYLLGHYIGDNHSEGCSYGTLYMDEDGMWKDDDTCNEVEQWLEGLIYVAFGVIVISLIYLWIVSNWEKAKERAIFEVKNNKLKKEEKR